MSLDAWLTLAARPLNRAQDLDPLMDAIGDRRVVLLGEATHGTREFYEWRAEVTKRLVVEKGHRFVAVEGDWPACREVDRHVRGEAHAEPEDALRAFARWPSWMWANEETVALARWMRSWNEHVDEARRVGFYGLDVYSLWESLDAVLAWLEENDHPAAEAAERALRCFEPYARDEQDYARATTWVPASCQDEVVRLLRELRGQGPGADAAFDAEQNALVAKNAEAYYRAMVRSGAESWNLRDGHMMDTLDRLLARHGKGVVWAHNTHVGDARATDMKDHGMLNLSWRGNASATTPTPSASRRSRAPSSRGVRGARPCARCDSRPPWRRRGSGASTRPWAATRSSFSTTRPRARAAGAATARWASCTTPSGKRGATTCPRTCRAGTTPSFT